MGNLVIEISSKIDKVMDPTNALIVGKGLADKIHEAYLIDNIHKIANNPRIKITNHSNIDFIGKLGELIHKGKDYSIISLDLNAQSISGSNSMYRMKNDCFEIISD